MRIVSFDILAVDLPFRRVFGHSAGSRRASDSIFLKCNVDDGTAGFGECLPRVYVTGENRDGAYGLLCDRVLPRLVGMRFESWADIGAFLDRCDGKAPGDWVAPEVPQTAAWCAVDLALLDAFGRAFGRSVFPPGVKDRVAGLRYSGVLHGLEGLVLRSRVRVGGAGGCLVNHVGGRPNLSECDLVHHAARCDQQGQHCHALFHLIRGAHIHPGLPI